jgi:hypothetical protein
MEKESLLIQAIKSIKIVNGIVYLDSMKQFALPHVVINKSN